jgi:hypothetical protein
MHKVVIIDNEKVMDEFKSLPLLLKKYPRDRYYIRLLSNKDDFTYELYTILPAKMTPKNIEAYIQGNLRYRLRDSLDDHIKSQIDYRMKVCKPCLDNGSCLVCGCKTPESFYANRACKINKYPQLMSKEDWNTYKELTEKENNNG